MTKNAVFILSFVHLFIYLFILPHNHSKFTPDFDSIVESRNVAIEKINMTEHRIVEMVGGT